MIVAIIPPANTFRISSGACTNCRFADFSHHGKYRRGSARVQGVRRFRRLWLSLRPRALDRLWIPSEHSRGICAVGSKLLSGLMNGQLNSAFFQYRYAVVVQRFLSSPQSLIVWWPITLTFFWTNETSVPLLRVRAFSASRRSSYS